MESAEPAVPRAPKWQRVYLVCRACGKRSKHPKGFKPKDAAVQLRRATKRDAPRARIVATGCLGLCPKGALAVACAGGGLETRIVAVTSPEALVDALPALTGDTPS